MKNIQASSTLVESILEIAWHFSSKGINGACCDNLSLSEFQALKTTAMTPDCSVQEIGKLLGFTKSGATRIVTRLEKQKLVTKHRSAADGRVCCVSPTEAGYALLQTAMECTSDRLEKALANIDASDRENVANALNVLANAVSLSGK